MLEPSATPKQIFRLSDLDGKPYRITRWMAPMIPAVGYKANITLLAVCEETGESVRLKINLRCADAETEQRKLRQAITALDAEVRKRKGTPW